MVDVDEIKRRYSPQKIAESLKFERQGSRYFCPKCQPAGSSQHKTPDLVVYSDVAHCFRCGWHADVIEVVMVSRSCSFREAVAYLVGGNGSTIGRWSRRHQNIPKPENGRSSPQTPGNIKAEVTPVRSVRSLNPRVYRQALPASIGQHYLEGRGISLNAAIQFGVGYAPPGQWPRTKRDAEHGRIVFCGYSYEDPERVVNLYGRAVEPVEKWLRHDIAYDGDKGFWSSDPPKALSATTVIVTEGPFDAWVLSLSASPFPAVAVFGTQSYRFENFPNARKVIFAFDCDQAGVEAFQKLAFESLLRGVAVFRLPASIYRNCKDLAESFQKYGSLEIRL